MSAEREKMLEYLRGRAAGLTAEAINARVRAAANELDGALKGVTAEDARRRAIPGEWTIAQVVDHLAQTTVRVAEELRHLLNGRRPPGPPVYDGITSAAAEWAPWPDLLAGLREANAEFEAVLSTAHGQDPKSDATAPAVLVVNRTTEDGRTEPDIWIEPLPWKEYAMVQRLHLLDHRNQVKKIRAAL